MHALAITHRWCEENLLNLKKDELSGNSSDLNLTETLLSAYMFDKKLYSYPEPTTTDSFFNGAGLMHHVSQ